MLDRKSWIALSVLAAVVLSSAGCNTAEGFSRDTREGERRIREEVRDARD